MNKPTIRERLARVEAELAEFRRTHHVDGTPRLDDAIPEVLSAAEQEARCWRAIGTWILKARGSVGAERGILWLGGCEYEVGHLIHDEWRLLKAAIGATRLDALAQAASWCETELADPQAMDLP